MSVIKNPFKEKSQDLLVFVIYQRNLWTNATYNAKLIGQDQFDAVTKEYDQNILPVFCSVNNTLI